MHSACPTGRSARPSYIVKIVVDGLPLTGPPSGIGRYTHELLRHLPRLRPDHAFTVHGVGRRWSGQPLDELQLDARHTPGSQICRPTGNLLWRMVLPFRDSALGDGLSILRRQVMTRVISRTRPDVFLGTNFLGLFQRGFKTVITIHDLAYRHYPEAANPYMLRLLSRHLNRHAQRADAVLTDSHHARRDIVEFLDVPAEKVVVAHPGVGPEFRPVEDRRNREGVRGKYGLPERFLLFVGTVEPRKNLEILVRAFDRMLCDEEVPHSLVIAGGKGWRDAGIRRAIEGVRDRTRVVCTGYVDDRDLPALYSLADVFVLPSLYEGFGLPVLEAMACGTPVVASQAASLPEVVGEAGLLFDPHSAEALAEALLHVVREETLRRSLAAAGLQRVRHFTWEQTARRVLEVLEAVVGGTFPPTLPETAITP